MQLRLPWSTPALRARTVVVNGRELPIETTRHRGARRYILRVTPAGHVRVTVPRSGSIAGALAFAASQDGWIARELARQTERAHWGVGTEVWYRGGRVVIARDGDVVTCGRHVVGHAGAPLDVRVSLQARWRSEASSELPTRCYALGRLHGLAPTRIVVRSQRSRWGSCSGRGTIALNWRLIQMPPDVADYVMLHELVHLEQPNHSVRFWRRVATVCPGWRDAERWLRTYGRELL